MGSILSKKSANKELRHFLSSMDDIRDNEKALCFLTFLENHIRSHARIFNGKWSWISIRGGHSPLGLKDNPFMNYANSYSVV